MKQLSLLIVALVFLFRLSTSAQSDVQKDARVSPILKKVLINSPGVRMFSRKEGQGRFVNMAVLNDNTKTLTLFTCHGTVFDSATLRADEYKKIIEGALDPFLFYRNYCYENLYYIEEAQLLYRSKGDAALRDTSENCRVVLNASPVKSATSSLQKLVAVETYMRGLCLRLRLLECRTPRQIAITDSSHFRETLRGVMFHNTDSTEYFNGDLFSAAARIVLRRVSPNKLFVYDKYESLIDSIPLKPGKYTSILKEKQDVFFLYRGWLELQWQQIIESKKQLLERPARSDQGLYESVALRQDAAEARTIADDLLCREIVVGNKISRLIVPDEKYLEHILAKVYSNEGSEISFLPGLGFAYNIFYTRGQKLYELADHRGNVMATVTDRKSESDDNSDGNIDYYNADVATASDYYPFGMLQPGRTYESDNNYRYGYNAKEDDNEVKGRGNQQDYGMRVYDPRIAKFLSLDPLTQKYPHYTPYSFAGNKPIAFIDRDGEEEGSVDFKMRRLEEAYFSKQITEDQYRQEVRAMGTAGTIGGVIVVDAFLTKGRISQFLFTAQVFGAFEHNRAKTPEGRLEQDERAKEILADAAITWGIGKAFATVGKVIKIPFVTLAKSERLKIFASKLQQAASASSQKEAIALINSTLDEVEDLFSGVKKAKGIPDRDDGRMYGILDEKYVTTLEDGTKIANTKGNRIVLETDGGFKIQTKDGSKTLIEKTGKKKP